MDQQSNLDLQQQQYRVVKHFLPTIALGDVWYVATPFLPCEKCCKITFHALLLFARLTDYKCMQPQDCEALSWVEPAKRPQC